MSFAYLEVSAFISELDFNKLQMMLSRRQPGDMLSHISGPKSF